MRILLLVLLAFLGATAILGSRPLLIDPTGTAMGTSVDLLEHTPFTDYFWPAFILCGLFGAGSLLVAATVLFRWRWSLRAAQAIGAGHMIWIAFQVFTIRPMFWLQALYFATGLMIFIAADRCRRLNKVR